MISYTCAKCNTELVCQKNGVLLVHYIDNDKTKGVDAIRAGDFCPICNCQVVIGLAERQTLGYEMTQDQIERWLSTHKVIEVKRAI